MGCTPWIKGAPRWAEIDTWLFGSEHWLAVTSYVVIDDANDADLGNGTLVQTTMPTGLTDEHVERAVAILNEGAE